MSNAPLEIKKLAIRLFKSGEYTQSAISKIVGYSVPAIKVWLAKDRRGLPLVAEERGHQPKKLDDSDRKLIREFIEKKPDATIEDVRKMLNYKSSKSAVHREMVELGFTFKKKRNTPTSKKGKTCSWQGWNGLSGWRPVIPNALFSLTRPPRKQI